MSGAKGATFDIVMTCHCILCRIAQYFPKSAVCLRARARVCMYVLVCNTFPKPSLASFVHSINITNQLSDFSAPITIYLFLTALYSYTLS
jgi:hypothetical protein